MMWESRIFLKNLGIWKSRKLRIFGSYESRNLGFYKYVRIYRSLGIWESKVSE